MLVASVYAPGQVTLAFPASHKIETFSLPDKPAALQMDVLHLKTGKNILTPNGAAREYLASDGSWVVSVHISPADRQLDSAGLREYSFGGISKGPFKIEQLRNYQQGSMALQEYMVENFRGQNVHQKNAFAYLVSGNQWFDVHISKVLYDPAYDEKFLNSMLNSIKLVEHYEPDTRIEYEYGSFFYLQNDWVRATAHYEKALDLARLRHKRELTPNEWRVLVDNLGMAYGMSRNLDKAKATFQYGITQDPAYPMFHYNLACTYAELDDLDSALADLKSAFSYRNNRIPGEGMPDPAKDDSFRRYLGDARFNSLARQICPESRQTATGFVCQ
jgi:tetratricopeptide (TPR) repeat protein